MLEIHDRKTLTCLGGDNPYLNGAWEPCATEWTASTPTLKVLQGEIPRDLQGVYMRNGHNQVHAPGDENEDDAQADRVGTSFCH